MSLKKNSLIPFDDHIIRYIPWARLRKDENDNVIGILGEAFKLRDKSENRVEEKHLSATWLEYFPNNNDSDNQIATAIRAIRNSKLNVKPKSAFSIGKVKDIQSACIKHNAKKVRIVYAPSQENLAHVAVKNYPRDNDSLYNLLAEESWASLIFNSDISK